MHNAWKMHHHAKRMGQDIMLGAWKINHRAQRAQEMIIMLDAWEMIHRADSTEQKDNKDDDKDRIPGNCLQQNTQRATGRKTRASRRKCLHARNAKETCNEEREKRWEIDRIGGNSRCQRPLMRCRTA
jgi:hypothetical protein